MEEIAAEFNARVLLNCPHCGLWFLHIIQTVCLDSWQRSEAEKKVRDVGDGCEIMCAHICCS